MASRQCGWSDGACSAGETAILGHIDWFLVRGLRAYKSAIIPAIDEQGNLISDHEMIVTTIAE